MAGSTKIKLVYTIGCLDMIAFGLFVPLFFAHLRSVGMSHLTIGALGTIHSGLQLLSSPVIGSWSDIRGHRFILQLILLVCSIFYFVLGATTTFPIILLSRIVLGMCEHTQILCGSLLAEVTPLDKQSEVQGRLASVGGMGFIVGPVIGGHLAELNNGFQYICCVVTLIFFTNFVLVYFFIPNMQHAKRKRYEENSNIRVKHNKEDSNPSSSGRLHETRDKSSDRSSTHNEPDIKHRTSITSTKNKDYVQNQSLGSKLEVKSLHSEIFQAVTDLLNINWTLYWDIFAFKFFCDFTLSLHRQNFGIILKDIYGVTPMWIGYTISLMGVTGCIVSFLAGWISKFYTKDETHATRAFHGCVAFTLSFILLSIAPNLLSIVMCLMLLSAACSVLRITISEIILQRTTPDQRGSLIGSAQSIMSLSLFAAPLFSGLTYELYGFQGMSTLKIVTALAALLFSVFLFKYKIEVKKQA